MTRPDLDAIEALVTQVRDAVYAGEVDAASARIVAAVHDIVVYIRELEVALLNERGEGEPPAPGWSSADNSDGALWWRDIEVDEDGCPVDSLLVHPSEGGTCAWERWVNCECLASGSAATAREAMVAADAALEVK